jgi:hypothetical protein
VWDHITAVLVRNAASRGVLDARGRAQEAPVLVADRGHLNPAVVGLVEPVPRVEAPLLGVQLRPHRRRPVLPNEDIRREHRATVHQRGPQLLTLTGAAPVVQRGEDPDDRQHRVGCVAHPEPVVERVVAVRHRAGLVLEPRGRLVQRIEPAEVRERAVEPVGVGVAVHQVGLDRPAGVVVQRESGGGALRHVVVHHVGGGDEPQRDVVPRRVLHVQG